MGQPIVPTSGQHEIKIYTVQNRGRAVFQLSCYEGGHRQRQTYGEPLVWRAGSGQASPGDDFVQADAAESL